MRVVHICNLPLSADHPDYGRIFNHPGRWVLNLAVAQKAHSDVIPELVVQVAGTKQNYKTLIQTIPVHYLAAPDYLRSATLFMFDRMRIADYVRRLEPDLVHAHGTEDAYSLAAQATALPAVITAQGLYFLINSKIRSSPISRANIVRFTEWLAFKRARHVIAKSDYVAAALKRRFSHLTLHSIPNTFDERILSVHESKRANTLVFVGTLSPWKGIHSLHEALMEVRRAIPNVTLDVVGDSTSSGSPYEVEQKRLLKKALGDRVVFHGQLGVLDLSRLVASSMALVAPSLEDMFGNQLVEALLVGTHGIVTEGTALAENIRRFGNGTIVPQENPSALAHAIVKALTDPTISRTIRKTQEAVASAFGPARVAALHHQVYNRILHSH